MTEAQIYCLLYHHIMCTVQMSEINVRHTQIFNRSYSIYSDTMFMDIGFIVSAQPKFYHVVKVTELFFSNSPIN